MTGTPKLRRHKPSGRAYVSLDGRRVYLGRWDGSGPEPAAVEAYGRLIAERAAHGTVPADDDLTVAELAAAFMEWARTYYSHSEAERCRKALADTAAIYGSLSVNAFGPRALAAVRQRWIADGHVRLQINAMVNTVRRAFRWGTEREMVRGEALHALNALSGLRRGRSEAAESEPVRPVSLDDVRITLRYTGRIVGAMVELQLLTGARPGEICSMRPCDVDAGGDVWLYRPAAHKTAWRGRIREIYLGPRSQAVLRPFLLRPPEAFCFSPRESEAERHARAEGHRRPNQRPNPKTTDRTIGDRYSTASYGTAIARAVKAAQDDGHALEPWRPNRLRHSAGTEARRLYGLEGAQILLGHSSADVTQVYAERNAELAVRIAREIG